jgi:hypothetical protein
LHVFSTCPEFIRSIPVLPYDARKAEDVDTNSDDHLYDAARYMMMAVGWQPIFHVVSDEAHREATGSGAETPEPFGPYALPADHVSPWGEGL